MTAPLIEVYRRLYESYGPQHWWPGDSPFEVMVGAVLVQNTAWKNVERAMTNLRDAAVMDPRKLYELPVEQLQELLRPAGYYRIKAGRLRHLLQLVMEGYGGSLKAMFAADDGTLREQLLRVKGIGPETADAIMLYAAKKPTFVVDTYAFRVLSRHGWIGYDADYYQIKKYFEDTLPREVPLYNEFHALLVRVGREHCRKSPRCDGCPLAELLPESGVVMPD